MEMKNTGQVHTYPSMDQPPPYSGPEPAHGQPSYGQPPYGPTVIQPGATTVIHPGSTTVIHRPPVQTIVVTNQMSPGATALICPSCNQQIVTRVEHKPSMRTHLFAILLCILGCWPCACLPYCMDTCNNADHYCPNCNSYIGTYMS